MVNLKCKICGNDFFVYKGRKDRAKFCSAKCTGKFTSLNLKGKVRTSLQKKCAMCENLFWVKKSEYNKMQTCSKQCASQNRSIKISKALKGRCTNPGGGFQKGNSLGALAGESKKGKHYSPRTEFKKGFIPWIKGKKGFTPWNKGMGKKSDRNMNGWKYREWRKSVFKRDNYTCQECKERGGNIQADHIELWVLKPELRYELSNGRTLCKECHNKKTKEDLSKYWKNQFASSSLR